MTSQRTTRATAEAFFYEWAGYSHGPHETPEQGRKRCARMLADAEAWLTSQPGFQVEWQQDGHTPEHAWGCIVKVEGRGDESLWGITFEGDGEPWGKPYARVVVAELALELMSE